MWGWFSCVTWSCSSAIKSPPPSPPGGGQWAGTLGGGGGRVLFFTFLQSVPCLNFPKHYVLYLTVLTQSYPYEPFILNFFLNSILELFWAEDRSVLHTSELHDNSYDFFRIFSSPRGRKHRKSYAGSASPSIYSRGVRLGPPLFSVLANARAGAGGRGQPLQMTIYTYLTSYALCSQEFSSLTLFLIHTYSQIAGSLLEGRSSSSSSPFLFFPCSLFTSH